MLSVPVLSPLLLLGTIGFRLSRLQMLEEKKYYQTTYLFWWTEMYVSMVLHLEVQRINENYETTTLTSLCIEDCFPAVGRG